MPAVRNSAPLNERCASEDKKSVNRRFHVRRPCVGAAIIFSFSKWFWHISSRAKIPTDEKHGCPAGSKAASRLSRAWKERAKTHPDRSNRPRILLIRALTHRLSWPGAGCWVPRLCSRSYGDDVAVIPLVGVANCFSRMFGRQNKGSYDVLCSKPLTDRLQGYKVVTKQS
jgi:hypothetical protein